MKTRTRELARAGIFGSVENPIVVKEADLKEIVETFPDIKKAPIKLGGHWSEDRPCLANVIAVSYDEKTKTLSGTIEEQDALSDAVDQGFYPDVSIGAKQRASDGKMYLHHLAYLGDEPPAVKDLESSLAETLTEAEQIAASDASDKYFTAFPSTSDRQLYLSDKSEFHERNKKDGGQSMTEEEFKAMQEENARLKAENEAKEKLLSDSLASEHEREKEALRHAAEGKITQPQMDELMALSDGFEAGKTIELSDSDGNKKAERPLAVLTRIFSSLKPKVEEGEMNLSDSDEPAQVESLNSSAI
ncbi:MAG: hypothetical protein KBT02_09015 [Treponema sp.]|nr:hypothetical protein [Candidatus Treponema caballi]